ncbi:MAG: serine/threonine protein kinase [Phycisphaerales bacterium]|nr:serine/threonine protein kinase [Phycisphaerales bacterium]
MDEVGVQFKKGDVVEGYKVLAELGQGAASSIYLVQDQKTKQIWALKHVVKRESKDQRFLDQAEQEVKVAQSLDHPGMRKIERLIKKGSFLATKELYLVMELVDGISMERSPPKTFEHAVHVFQQVAEAMHHMHERGWVHADMKPNNIIVDDQSRAKVIDLGQSCKIGTIKERIQGTPDYIAPEQVHRRAITPRTDVYNLGASIYWTLTRQHIPTALAKGDSLVGSIDDNLMEKPTPAIELNPKVHPKLNDLIMLCVEVDPEKRPPDMKFVAERLNLIHGILLAQAGKGRAPVGDESTMA